MRKLVMLALVGCAAQLVDGALGMGYGVTSSTLLLLAGVAPASASASVHLAEIGTTLAAGTAHWRFGNVDWAVVRRIALPGAVGAFLGATLLSNIPTDIAAPWMAGILLVLGAYLLLRFARPLGARTTRRPLRTRFLAPLGLVAGFVDATGGGGWGPVATPSLLVSGRMEPRKVVGSVDASEVVVASAASIGFLIGLSSSGFVLPLVAALLAGGLVAAPIAAYLVRIMPAQLLGAVVGGMIILTNSRTMMKAFDLADGVRPVVYGLILVAWATAVVFAVRALRASSAAAAAATAAATTATAATADPVEVAGEQVPGEQVPGGQVPAAERAEVPAAL